MSESLEVILEKFNKTSELKVIFDETDSKFYDVTSGSKKELKFPAYVPSEEEKKYRTLTFGISNSEYTSRLSEPYKNLRGIIIGQVDKLVVQEMVKRGVMRIGNDGRAHSAHLGACHAIWDYRKKVLKENYNIDWASPKDEDPFTLFD